MTAGVAEAMIGAVSDQDQKVVENRLRRMALRQGLYIRKCPRRDPMALGYGLWSIESVRTGAMLTNGYQYGNDEILRFLTRDRPTFLRIARVLADELGHPEVLPEDELIMRYVLATAPPTSSTPTTETEII